MKAEFRRRLIYLQKAITKALETDSTQNGLFSALFSVFSYIWCKSPRDMNNFKYRPSC